MSRRSIAKSTVWLAPVAVAAAAPYASASTAVCPVTVTTGSVPSANNVTLSTVNWNNNPACPQPSSDPLQDYILTSQAKVVFTNTAAVDSGTLTGTFQIAFITDPNWDYATYPMDPKINGVMGGSVVGPVTPVVVGQAASGPNGMTVNATYTIPPLAAGATVEFRLDLTMNSYPALETHCPYDQLNPYPVNIDGALTWLNVTLIDSTVGACAPARLYYSLEGSHGEKAVGIPVGG